MKNIQHNNHKTHQSFGIYLISSHSISFVILHSPPSPTYHQKLHKRSSASPSAPSSASDSDPGSNHGSSPWILQLSPDA